MNVRPKLGGGIPFRPEFGGGQVHIFGVSVRKSLGNAYLVEFFEIFTYNCGNAFEFLIFILFQNVLVCFRNKMNIIIYTVHKVITLHREASRGVIRLLGVVNFAFTQRLVLASTHYNRELEAELPPVITSLA